MAFSNQEEKGRPVKIKDEGISLVDNVAEIDFIGGGVFGANVGDAVTETIAGGSSGTVEDLSAQCNGSLTVFVTTSNTGIIWLSLNGTMLIEGKEFTRDSATQITLTFAPDTGEELYLKYV